MLAFDDLMKVPDNVKLGYLRVAVEEVISKAPDNKVLKLRALQAKMDGIRNKYPPSVASGLIFEEMLAMCLVMGAMVS